MRERRTVEIGVPRNKRTRVLGVPEVARPYELTFNMPLVVGLAPPVAKGCNIIFFGRIAWGSPKRMQ